MRTGAVHTWVVRTGRPACTVARVAVAGLVAVGLAACSGADATPPPAARPPGPPGADSSSSATISWPPETSRPTDASPSTGSPSTGSPSIGTPSTGTWPTTEPVVVVLDPGHNGGNAAHPRQINRLVPAGGYRKPCNTTGTATASGYAEHTFAWDVAKRTARLLRRQGVTVVLTRPDDRGVGPCVDRRARIANHRKAALTVSIHADGGPSGARGFHVAAPAPAPDGKNRAVLTPSWRAARLLADAFGDATGEPRARYPGGLVEPGLSRRDDLATLNLARVPAVLVECGNMRNAEDAAGLRSAAWRQRAARGIAGGVLAFVADR